MHKPMTDADVVRLRSENLPHATVEVFSMVPDGATYEDTEITKTEYAERFVAPQADCPNCGYNSIHWTLQHGVACCTNCGYPCRVYHYFNGTTRVQKSLWYHPDVLMVKGEVDNGKS